MLNTNLPILNCLSHLGGDSGGPLINAHDGNLIGLTNFGHKDSIENRLPQAFTNVSVYQSWIDEITGINLTDPFSSSSASKIQSFFNKLKSIFSD